MGTLLMVMEREMKVEGGGCKNEIGEGKSKYLKSRVTFAMKHYKD